ncbi:MAG: circularly permuted type 2 ATP-grasp protein [Dermatophilaceae bacterium]
MSVDPSGRTGDVIEDYRALPSAGVDELVRAGRVSEISAEVADTMRRVGADGLTEWADRVRSFIAEEGISYGVRGAASSSPGWTLDPVPVLLSAAEWDRMESGLAQRAMLLDAVLGDIYGERRLVRRGLLPAETFLGHAGFLHQASGIRLPGPRQLVLAAADLARDTSGSWRLLGDRAQAPSGAAYAMANRRIIARVLPILHRRTDLARLRGFFDAMRQALQAAAPPGMDSPRVVVLSPGPLSETAYDQALTATLLGFPLVESDDLAARDGQLWLRTTGGLERVDVLLRRVDAEWCDNLELRAESRLGVPGLVEAARLGSCSIVNPLGAAVLENAALLPFLDGICRAVTGEDLQLRPAETWWCGDAVARSHVLANLSRLVVKPISRGIGPSSRFGWQLSADERAALRAHIEAQPWAWAAQEPLAMSTAPVVTPEGLQPRRLVLRTFGVAEGDGYRFLPGGLARVAATPDSAMVTSMTGAPSKDVWVLADRDSERGAPRSARRGAARGHTAAFDAPFAHDATDLDAILGVAGVGSVTPRVAEDFYWLGRYLERVEATARLLRVAADLDEDHGLRPGTPGAMTLGVVVHALAEVSTVPASPTPSPGASPGGPTGEGSQRYLTTVLFDPQTPGTVTYAARRAIRTARAMREQLSQDVWLILSRLERSLARHDPASTNAHLQSVIGDTLELTLAVAGIQHESLVRGPEWCFLDAGRRIERAQHTVRVLRHTVAVERPPVIDAQVTEAILVAGESVIAHRRRTAAGHGPLEPFLAAVDLLLLDGGNPRSVRHAVDQLGDDLAQLPPERVSVEGVLDLLGTVDIHELGTEGRARLAALLEQISTRLLELSTAITGRYFVHQAPQRPLPWHFDLGGRSGAMSRTPDE